MVMQRKVTSVKSVEPVGMVDGRFPTTVGKTVFESGEKLLGVVVIEQVRLTLWNGQQRVRCDMRARGRVASNGRASFPPTTLLLLLRGDLPGGEVRLADERFSGLVCVGAEGRRQCQDDAAEFCLLTIELALDPCLPPLTA